MKKMLALIALLPALSFALPTSNAPTYDEQLRFETTPGGWSAFTTDLEDSDIEVLREALYGRVGVSYQALAVSTQVVAGINYKFFANATVVYPGAEPYPVFINVYAPLEGKPYILSIEDL